MEFLITSYWFIWVVAALTGYLIGSISFARIISRLFGSTGEVKQIHREIPDTELTLESEAVAATTINLQLGPQYGCLTSLLDAAKAALPTWVFLYFFPDQHVYLATAFFAMTGHNYPLYHHFKGGRGLSPVIGSLLIIDWMGLLLSQLAALMLGYLTGAVLAMRWAWMGILILWFILFPKDLWHAGYMTASTLLFFFSMRKELITAIKIGRARKSTQEEVSEFMLMGRGLGRFIDHNGLPALIRKAFRSGKKKKGEGR